MVTVDYITANITEFLLINRYSQILLGLWPTKYLKKNLVMAYKAYRMVAIPLTCTFLSTFSIEVCRTPFKKFSDLLEPAGTGVLYTVTLVKMYYCTSNLANKLIKEIYEEEKRLAEMDREHRLNIWQQEAKYNAFFAKSIQYFGLCTLLPYLAFPLYERYSAHQISRNDSTVPSLPFKFYVPFNVSHQYTAAYIFQSFGGLYATVAICSCDTLLVAFMNFCTCQCKMLQQSLIKFGESSHLGMESELLVQCIMYHKKIISFAGILNQLVRPLMFLEFITSSLHLSVVLLQVIVSGLGARQIFILEFAFAMVVQIMLFYWHANELIVESVALSKIIYESKWYICSQRTKKTLQIMMMRSQKPLTLSVGPFYVMSTETALLILKTAYSYLALLHNTRK